MGKNYKKVYAIHGGDHQGIYYTWDECKKYTLGQKGLKFKGFKNEEEALFFSVHGRTPEIETVQDTITIYTDGACQNMKKAGIGVYFGENHDWNLSEPLLDDYPTNQKAEIVAIIRAMEILNDNHVEKDSIIIAIYTDSKYCFNIYHSWYNMWEKSKWITKTGSPVKNKEIIQKMVRLLKERNTRLYHINSHCGIKGNEEADKLAVNGCKMI